MKEYTFNRRLRIDDLDLTFQARAAMDADIVDEYAEAMADHVKFPPIEVRELETPQQPRYIVTDGQHRVAAAKKIGQTEIIARVVPGTLKTALLDVLKANSTHGLRRTNADKRHALEMAWMHRREIWPREDGADPSVDVLAKACGVSRRTVIYFLSEQPVQIAPVDTTDNVGGSNSSTLDNVQSSTPAAPQMPTRATPAQPAQTQPMPTMPRRVFGVDGKVRTMPPKMPTRSTAAGFGTVAADGHVVPIDRFGVEIPLEIGSAFTVEAEKVFAAILHAVSEARTAVKNGRANDAAFAAMRQETEFSLNNAYSYVKAAMPYCVCRVCQGNGCKACHERGWQTEEEYNRNPVEFKA
jgi:uncharacterized ParB-like nuclease family protein